MSPCKMRRSFEKCFTSELGNLRNSGRVHLSRHQFYLRDCKALTWDSRGHAALTGADTRQQYASDEAVFISIDTSRWR